MLRNLKVGTKLALTLLAPLVVLCILAGLGVADRSQRAADARQAQRLAELTNAAGRATKALEIEQLYSAILVATKGESGTDGVLVQYGDTEAAIVELSDAVKAAEGIDERLDGRLTNLARALGELGGLRSDIAANKADVDTLTNRYEDISEALVQVVSGVPAVPNLGQLGTALSDASLVFQGIHILGDGLTEISVAAAEKQISGKRRSHAVEQIALANQSLSDFLDRTSPLYRDQLTKANESPETQDLDAQVQAILGQSRSLGEDSAPIPLVANYGKVRDLEVRRIDSLLLVQQTLTRDIAASAATDRKAANRAVRLYLLGAALGIGLAAIAALVVGSSIARPLRRLTMAANQLATEDLPELVARLRSPGPAVTPVPRQILTKAGSDEVGQLAVALDAIQRTTLDVAQEQAGLLRKGISDIFVNLARRNQTLLDRQIEFIDQLEARETDPDQLQSLFRLDHLATRMRRNAESLLVLAGAEPARRRGRPVGLTDVVRVALGEVEDYTRITLLSLDEVRVPGNVAVDLSHVLAELMDNATQFSPPQSAVEVIGHHNREGGYVLSVTDQGIGMTPEQLADANLTLANPPLMGLTLSRSLGFVVVARLAARHNVGVRLAATDRGGLTALVNLPTELLSHGADPTAAPVASSRDSSTNGYGAASEQAPAPALQPAPTGPMLHGPRVLQARSHQEAGVTGSEAFTYFDVGEATGMTRADAPMPTAIRRRFRRRFRRQSLPPPPPPRRLLPSTRSLLAPLWTRGQHRSCQGVPRWPSAFPTQFRLNPLPGRRSQRSRYPAAVHLSKPGRSQHRQRCKPL